MNIWVRIHDIPTILIDNDQVAHQTGVSLGSIIATITVNTKLQYGECLCYLPLKTQGVTAAEPTVASADASTTSAAAPTMAPRPPMDTTTKANPALEKDMGSINVFTNKLMAIYAITYQMPTRKLFTSKLTLNLINFLPPKRRIGLNDLEQLG
ncbi:hypothetical protein V6N13_101157 [Hibiscus sabdariffa]